jgi:CheY-like chemotaxis protein
MRRGIEAPGSDIPGAFSCAAGAFAPHLTFLASQSIGSEFSQSCSGEPIEEAARNVLRCFLSNLPNTGALRVLREKAAPVSPSAGKSLPNRCVLVIDDNRDAANSLAQVVELWGYEPIVAFDGPSGIALAKIHCPSVVFLDVGLPGGINGFEVARILREECHFNETLIIAVTGYAQEEDKEKTLRAGCDHHLAKPADLEFVEQLLKAHFEAGERSTPV